MRNTAYIDRRGLAVLIAVLSLLTFAALQAQSTQEIETSSAETASDSGGVSAENKMKSSLEFQKGKRKYMNGDYDGAMYHFEKSIEFNPQNSEALNYYGGAYFHKEQYDKAIDFYSRAISANDKAYWILHNKGVAEHHNGNYNAAIQDFSQTLEQKSDYYKSVYQRGLVYIEKNEYDLALGDFTNAIMLNPKDYKAWYLLGLIYYEKGDEDRAKRNFQKAKSLSRSAELPYYTEGKNPFAVNGTETAPAVSAEPTVEERARSN
jgi:tetratricopeptide (TPR) repeat protein